MELDLDTALPQVDDLVLPTNFADSPEPLSLPQANELGLPESPVITSTEASDLGFSLDTESFGGLDISLPTTLVDSTELTEGDKIDVSLPLLESQQMTFDFDDEVTAEETKVFVSFFFLLINLNVT